MTDSGDGIRATRRWFLPSFDETTLFLMAVTCLLLLAYPSGLRNDLWMLIAEPDDSTFYLLIFFGWASVGLGVSLFHAFSRRPKGEIAKLSMAVFAMVTNVAAGVLLGIGRMNGTIQGGRWLAMINMCAALLLVYEIGFFGGSVIDNGDATPRDLWIGLLALAVLFVLLEVVRHLPWPLTFSLCVAYSTFIHHNAVAFSRQIGARALARRSV